ncbi:MAG: (2Fe-2S)-binding protein [Chloroflexi bacterium]|nr:(2Fe-2S)-binding protein [Chloroflexota bacterium]
MEENKVARQLLTMMVNGESVTVAVEPSAMLLDVLRHELHLTGAKESCGKGDCGTCAVLLDGKAINSCITPAMKAMNREVLTIEGLSRSGQLHPIQEAFVAHGAVQCGFCTPGMVLAAKALLDENPAPTELEVRVALSGNLCRCTGYVKIIEAVLSAAAKLRR